MFSESYYMNIIEQYDQSVWIFYILVRTRYAIKNILMISKNVYSGVAITRRYLDR